MLPIERVGLRFPFIAELHCINGNISNFLPKSEVRATPTVDIEAEFKKIDRDKYLSVVIVNSVAGLYQGI